VRCETQQSESHESLDQLRRKAEQDARESSRHLFVSHHHDCRGKINVPPSRT